MRRQKGFSKINSESRGWINMTSKSLTIVCFLIGTPRGERRVSPGGQCRGRMHTSHAIRSAAQATTSAQ
jgi:hypothetical protein